MNPELREAIGKAIYVSLTLDAIPWHYLSETTQEYYRACADKAVETLLQPIVPTLVELTKSLVGPNQHQQDAIRHIVKTVTGKELEEL